MLIKRPKGWEIRESALTPESNFLDRRKLLAGFGGLAAGLAMPHLAPNPVHAAAPAEVDPSGRLYPFPRNGRYTLGDRTITPESKAGNYNNFYEFGQTKKIAAEAQALRTRPWMIAIDGLVEKPFEIGIDELIARMPLEERAYRHRCVEAWSMAVHWSGFPLRALVELARPQRNAHYVQFQTFFDPSMAPAQKRGWYDWPYTEAVTLAEAVHDLAFLATGVYGKPLPKQFGAPLRLALPWKYGFKSIKSIRKISFTANRPVSFWEASQPQAYGFWANVNPEVAHPRWSQASEEVLGQWFRQPTQLFNGYAEFVAGLYKDLQHERLYV